MKGWIMGCVRSARFTIVFNGPGQGFFIPQYGLRQGCALSPYLFIIGMDLLSRTLQYLVDKGQLKGVCIAPKAAPLTNSLYADDLLIFGKADPQEAALIMHVLREFERVSGQRIGPEKSKVWFSNCTPTEVQLEVARRLGVALDATADKYLGAPISASRGSYDFLIEKLSAKLNMWKSKTLSQAGRLVLIKSALQSIPIYYMATAQVPKKVILQLEGLTRRFFWGALDKQRYMSYIAWDKLKLPRDRGGLAIRDFESVNQALLMKSLWKLAKKADTQWVNLVIAKYIPNSRLWHSRRTYRCTNFWRGVMNLREVLITIVKWEVGDGAGVKAYGEPWFENALQFIPQNSEQRALTVRDLVNQEQGGWDMGRIMQEFGHQACVQIISGLDPPAPHKGSQRLIFSLTTDGEYSVKRAYNHIRYGGTGLTKDPLWNIIWKKGIVVPRVRLFMWKLVQNGLPLAQVLVHRTSRGDPFCMVCKGAVEDALHLVFGCPFTKACWFGGSLALRTDELASKDSVKDAILDLAAMCSNELWMEVAATIWAVWRCRNDRTYAAKEPSFDQFRRYQKDMLWEARYSKKDMGLCSSIPPVTVPGSEDPTRYCCQVDGSWVGNWEGGIGVVVLQNGTLLTAISKGVKAATPFQAEAIALLEATRYMTELGYLKCIFHTDCKALADAISAAQPPLRVDWTGFREVFEVWRMFRECKEFECCYVPRCQLGLADRLAKEGSKKKWDFACHTYPILNFDADPMQYHQNEDRGLG